MIDKNSQVFIGLMSGTSLDGIDAVLVEFSSDSEFTLLETVFTPYSPELRKQIDFAAQNNTSFYKNTDSLLHDELAPVYAHACEQLIKKADFKKSNICGIANHGQTIKHEPLATPAYSLQIGNGQRLANLTGIDVYTQFRQADLAEGGQGAPLMPAFHAAWLQKKPQKNETVMVLNIGGIANITKLGHDVIGFDTGPGNVLMDQWIEKHLGQHYDENGNWAQQGQVNHDLLASLLSDSYFTLEYPKSTGTDYFNLNFLYQNEVYSDQLDACNVQATLLQLSADSIALEIERLASSGVIYVCGGGAKNHQLMQALKKRLSNFNIDTTDTAGVPSDWVEAVGFAWLGYCCKNQIISNMPSVTGANKEVVLGELFSPQAF